MGASDTTGNASVVDGKLISETENNKTHKRASATANTEIESVRGNDGVVFNGKLFTSVSIGTGISNNSEEQMWRKFKCEQLQQWSLILFALNRQKSQYQQLRERLSKIGEGRVVKKELVIDNICNVCSCQINIIDSESFITCFVCNKKICHAAKCSSLVPISGRWECRLCHSSKDSLTNTQSWIAEQIFFNRQKYVYPMRARSEIYIPIRDYNEGFTNFEGVNQTGIDSSVITPNQKTKIREYVEEVVAKLLGGSLDQIRVTQLSKSENNLPGILNKQVVHQHPVGLNDNQINENILTEFSEISQTRLRHMVESIITEMLETPSLTNVNVSEPELNTNTYGIGRPRPCHRHRTEHYFEPNSYQDFLATAVLNKISDKEGNFRQFSESTPDLSSCNIDDFNMNDRSTSSGSSLEPINGFSYTDAEYSPKIIKDLNRESTINDYIASHAVPLPDLSAVMTESEEDDNASVSSSILREGNWENNWLFRKKRSSLTTSVTGSIGMLVPAPKNDVRAQIGDKTTDEISDLSEIDSDTDDSSVKICAGLDPFNDRILNKHLIGGQNIKVILDELIETASLISNTSQSPNEDNYIEAMNEHIVEIPSKPEAFNSGVPNKLPYEAEISLKSTPEGCYEVHTTLEVENNPLSAPLQTTESIEVDESCTGFSSVEIFEETVFSHDTRSICLGASVIENLAAITLGPLLGVPASEQPSIQAPFEMSSLIELSDLALAEIKSRIPELRHHSLDIIDEEEETKVMNSLEINENCSEKCAVLSDIKKDTISPLINNTTANLTDETSLDKLSTKIYAKTPSTEITEVLLPSSLKRTLFKDSKKSIQPPQLRILSIEEPSNSKLMYSDSEKIPSLKTAITCSSGEVHSELKPTDKISEILAIQKEPKTDFKFKIVSDLPDCGIVPILSAVESQHSIKTEISKISEREKPPSHHESEVECILEVQHIEKENKTHYNDTERKYVMETRTFLSSNSYPSRSCSEEQKASEKDKLKTYSKAVIDDVIYTKNILFSETETSEIEKQTPYNKTRYERNTDTEPALFSRNNKAPKIYIQKSCIEAERVCRLLRESEILEYFRTPKISENKNEKILHGAEAESDKDTKVLVPSRGSQTSVREIRERYNEASHKNIITTQALACPELLQTSENHQFSSKQILKSRKENPYNEPDNENEINRSQETFKSPKNLKSEERKPIDKTQEINNIEIKIDELFHPPQTERLKLRNNSDAYADDNIEKSDNHRTLQLETATMPYTSKSEKQTPYNQLGQGVMDVESENRIPFSDNFMDTNGVKFSATEGKKQKHGNEGKGECVTDTESENRIHFSKQKGECANEAQKSSEIPYISRTERQEMISELRGDNFMDTEVVELPETESEKQKLCYESEGDNVIDTETVQSSVIEIEKQKPSIKLGIECVMDIFSEQTEECENETETQETSKILYASTTDNQGLISESRGDYFIDAEEVNFVATESGKQKPRIEPEKGYLMDTKLEDRIPFREQKEGGNEAEALESSETPNISTTEQQEPNSESKRDSAVATETVELYAICNLQSEKQKSANEPEDECIESENPIPFRMQKEDCANKIGASEFSQTPYTSATEKKEPSTVKEYIVMHTETVELSATESEKQKIFYEPEEHCTMDTEAAQFSPTTGEIRNTANEPEEECVIDTERENRIPFSEQTKGADGYNVMDTETVESPAIEIEIEKQKPSIKLGIECVMDIFSKQTEECENETETQETSKILYASTTDNQGLISESRGDYFIDAEEVNFVATESGKQKPRIEPEKGYLMDTKLEDRIPFREQKEGGNEAEALESSETPNISTTEQQEPNSESKRDSAIATETVELSAICNLQSEKQKSGNEPEDECIESENPIPFRMQKEDCANKIGASEFSQTPYTSATEKKEPSTVKEYIVMHTETVELSATESEKQKIFYEPEKHCTMDTKAAQFSPTTGEIRNTANEPEEECVIDSERENRIPFSEQTKGAEGYNVMDTETVEFSATESSNEKLTNEPEEECVTDTESKNGVPRSNQTEEYANEAETQETSKTSLTSTTEQQELSSVSKGDSAMGTEAVEFSAAENENQTPCNDGKGECVIDTENENHVPSGKQTKECSSEETVESPAIEIEKQKSSIKLGIECVMDIFSEQTEECENETETQETSKTLYASTTDNQGLISESKGDYFIDTEKVIFAATESEKQKPRIEPEKGYLMDTKLEDRIPFREQKEGGNEAEALESSETPNTSTTEQQEPNNESKRDSAIATETVELYAICNLQSEKQKSVNEPEDECTESQNPIPFRMQKEDCANTIEASESSQTPYTSATEKKEPSTVKGYIVMHTETVELSATESEKQKIFYEPEEHCTMDTEAAQFSPTTDEIRNTANEPEEECVIDTERENRIPFSEQTKGAEGYNVMDTETVEFSATESSNEKFTNEPEEECVTDTENKNGVALSKQTEEYANEAETQETSKTSLTSTTEQQELSSESKGDSAMGTEAVEFSAAETENQTPSIELKGECVIDTENENHVPFSKQTKECSSEETVESSAIEIEKQKPSIKLGIGCVMDIFSEQTEECENETETQETSKILYASTTDNQGLISESKGDYFIDTEKVIFAATESEKQKPRIEPEKGYLMDTKLEDRIPFREQKEGGNEAEALESSETPNTSTTEQQEPNNESKRDSAIATETVELYAICNLQSEKQKSVNEPEDECTESQNPIPFRMQKEDCANTIEASESSQTPYTSATEKKEPSTVKGYIVMHTETVELSATESEKQKIFYEPEEHCTMDTEAAQFSPTTDEIRNTANEPEEECVIDTERENRIPFSEQTKGAEGYNVMDTETVEFSATESSNEKFTNEPEEECVTDTENKNGVALSKQTEEYANEAETQETSKTSLTSTTEQQELSSESKGDSAMGTEAVEFSAAETENQTPSIELKGECVIDTENENHVPFSKQTKECSSEETVESSAIEIEKQKPSIKLGIGCVMDIFSEQTEECENETETQETSKILYASTTDNQGLISESKGDYFIDTEKVIFAATESEKQKPRIEPEKGYLMDTKLEDRIPFREQKEGGNEAEALESSETPNISTTEQQEPNRESKRDSAIATETVELYTICNLQSEKQKSANEPEDECIESENPIPFRMQKEDCANKIGASEFSQTPYTSATEKKEPSTVKEYIVMHTETVELSATESEKQKIFYEPEEHCTMYTEAVQFSPTTGEIRNTANEPEKECVIDTERESRIPFSEQTKGAEGYNVMDTETVEFSATESSNEKLTNEPEEECVTDAENKNGVALSKQTEEYANEAETQETSKTSLSSITEQQELSSESKGDSAMGTEAVEFSAAETENQTPSIELKGERVIDTENENHVPFSKQTKECSSEETVESSAIEIEKQKPSIKLGIGCVMDIFSEQTEECENETEAQETSKILYASTTDNQGLISESKGDYFIDTEKVIFAATESEKQKPRIEPEKGYLMDTKLEDRIPFREQKDGGNEAEALESSETPNISTTEQQEPNRESKRDSAIATETVELYAICNLQSEKQKSANEPEDECTESENPIPFRMQKEDCANTIEASESLQTPYTSATEKKEPSTVKGYIVMHTETVELSATESEKQKIFYEPEEHCTMYTEAVQFSPTTGEIRNTANEPEKECVIDTERENRIPFSEQTKGAEGYNVMDTETVEFSATESSNEKFTNEPEEECVTDAENKNGVALSKQTEEYANEAETQETSKTSLTSTTEQQELSSESKGDSAMGTEAVEFSAAETENQTPSIELKGECVIDTENENHVPFSKQTKECSSEETVESSAIEIEKQKPSIKLGIGCVMDIFSEQTEECENETETQETSKILYASTTDNQGLISESKGDYFIDTEKVIFAATESEKQKPRIEPEKGYVMDTKLEDRIPFREQKEGGNEAEALESSETPNISTTEQQEPNRESKRDSAIATETVELYTICNLQSEKQKSANEPEDECIESENPIPFRMQKEDCANKIGASEFSQTPYTSATEKKEPSTVKGYIVMHTETVELSATESEKQKIFYEPEEHCTMYTEAVQFSPTTGEIRNTANEPEEECVIDSERENRIPFSEQTKGAEGYNVMDTETVEFSATESSNEKLTNEPEEECVTDTESKNGVPRSNQTEEYANEAETQETSKTSLTSTTEQQELSSESKGDSAMGTEAVEFSAAETENQTPSIELKGECVIDTENENHVPFSKQTKECSNEVETQETSKTQYTFITEKSELISESRGDNLMNTEVVEFSATESEKQKPCNEPQEECVTDTESKCRIPFIKHKGECANGAQESSGIPHISTTGKREPSNAKGYNVMGMKTVEFSGIERSNQKLTNEPKKECVTDTENENRVPLNKQTEECTNEAETQEASKTPYTFTIEKPELIRESRRLHFINTGAVEFSATESGNRIPFTEEKKDCANEAESHESNERSYTSTEAVEFFTTKSKKQKTFYESGGGSVMNTEAVELYTIEKEKQNHSNEQKGKSIMAIFSEEAGKCANEAEAQETSKTPYTYTTAKPELVSESRSDNLMDIEVVEFSATKSKKQKSCNEPKEECVTDTESKCRIPFIKHKGECANGAQESSGIQYISTTGKQKPSNAKGYNAMGTETVEFSATESSNQIEAVPQETSKISLTSTTEQQEPSSGSKGDSATGMEAVKFSAAENEKQTTCNEQKGECVTDTERKSSTSFINQKGECAKEVETQETSKTSLNSTTEQQEPSSESKGNSAMGKEPVENSTAENEKHTPGNDQKGECVIDTENENQIPFSKQTKQCSSEIETQETSKTPYTFITETPELISESRGDNLMDIEAVKVHAGESEKQNLSTEPENEYPMDTKEKDRIPFREQKEAGKEPEAHKISETPYTSTSERQEPSNGSKRESGIDAETVEFSAIEGEKQRPYSKPGIECIMDISSEQAEECEDEAETQETSIPLYTSTTGNQGLISESKDDYFIYTEEVEFSTTESEKQKSANEPEHECAADTEKENPIPFRAQTEECANEIKVSEFSQTQYSSAAEKEEPSIAKGYKVMHTETVELSATESEKQKIFYEPVGYSVMNTEGVESLAIEGKNQNTANEPKGECVIDTESENGIPFSKQREECTNEAETQETSKTSYTSSTEKPELINESRGYNIMDTGAVFSATEGEIGINFSEEGKDCAKEKEAHEFTETQYTSITERPEVISESRRDNFMDTEAVEFFAADSKKPKCSYEPGGDSFMDREAVQFFAIGSEKQKPCDEQKEKCVTDTENENRVSFNKQTDNCVNETEAQQSSKTPNTSETEKQGASSGDKEDTIIDTIVLESCSVKCEISNHCSDAEDESNINKDQEIATSPKISNGKERKLIDSSEECSDIQLKVQESPETQQDSESIKFELYIGIDREDIIEMENLGIHGAQQTLSLETAYISGIESQNSCKKIEGKYIMGTENDSNIEAQESFETSYTCQTEKKESSSDLKENIFLDTETMELSASESGKQKPYNKSEIKCVMYSESENRLCSASEEQYVSETQETYETLCNSGTEKQILSSEAKTYFVLDIVERRCTSKDNKQKTPMNIEGECVIIPEALTYPEFTFEGRNQKIRDESKKEFSPNITTRASENKRPKIYSETGKEYSNNTKTILQPPHNETPPCDTKDETENENYVQMGRSQLSGSVNRSAISGIKEECEIAGKIALYSEAAKKSDGELETEAKVFCYSVMDLEQQKPVQLIDRRAITNKDYAETIKQSLVLEILPQRLQTAEIKPKSEPQISDSDNLKTKFPIDKVVSSKSSHFAQIETSILGISRMTMMSTGHVYCTAQQESQTEPKEKYSEYQKANIIEGTKHKDVAQNQGTVLSIQTTDIDVPLKTSDCTSDNICILEEKSVTKSQNTLESVTETKMAVQYGLSLENVLDREIPDLCKAIKIVTMVKNLKTAEIIESCKTNYAKINIRKKEDKPRLISTGITIANDSCKSTETEPVKDLSKVIDISKCSNQFTTLNNGIVSGTTLTIDNNTASVVAETSDAKSSDHPNIYPNGSGTVVVELLSRLNTPVTKPLHRQSHKNDVASSDEKCSLRTFIYIATMCKTLINDKRLLASLERRRRQTEIMQKYLRSIDSFEFNSDYFEQDLLQEQAFILTTPPPPLPQANIAAEIDSHFTKSLREFRFNFLNDILFSDQLSSATNLADKNVPTTIESYLVVYNNEQDIIHTNNCNNSFVNTTKLTNGSFPNLTPNSKSNGKQGQQFVYNNNYQQDNNGEEDDVVPLRYFVPGSIAEREYKKWNNAVEMPNNPYSLEALKRRISGSQERFIDLPNISSSTNKNVITVKAEDDAENESTSNIGYKRYSRDYYINTDNTPEDNPNHQILRNDRRKRINSGCSEEVIKDTVTKESISQGNQANTKENSIVIHPTVYLALPAQVVEDSASFETLSNQSMQSVNTTTSDDSDTICIYDFKKQTTVIVHKKGKRLATDTTAIKTADSVKSFQATTSECSSTEDTIAKSKKFSEFKVLGHTELSLETKVAETCVSTLSPGPTPKAFKFLQPKRRLIDPSQVLLLDEEAHGLSFGEKQVVEEEVAQAMPSVKALAQAFLVSSNKCSQAEKRWKKGIQKMPSTSAKFNNPLATQTENMVTTPEMTEDATLASGLSSLETDPSTNVDILTNKTRKSSPEHTTNYEKNNKENTTNILRRVSMLKSNIAFFENLKFK